MGREILSQPAELEPAFQPGEPRDGISSSWDGELDENLEQLVLEKTEGVPFFIEELISSLKYQGIIEKKDNKYCLSKDIQEMTVPSTIQDVIMARMDALLEGAKALLQTGSVVGREFSHDLIQKVTELSEEELLLPIFRS